MPPLFPTRLSILAVRVTPDSTNGVGGEPLRPQSVHQRDIIDDCDPHLIEVFRGDSKKSASFVHSMSASPIIAV